MMNSTSAETEETLRMVAQAAADFARPDSQRTRKIRDSAGGFDHATWQGFADQGWLAALLPEDQGGTGLGLGAAAIISERLGYACYTEPFVPIAVAAMQCMLSCPAGDTRDNLLESAGSGMKTVTLAWQSQRGDLDIDTSQVIAMLDSDIVSLSGAVRFVHAPYADIFIVAAHVHDGIGLYAVPAGTVGLSVTPERAADGSSSALLRLENARISSVNMLAQGTNAEVALSGAIDAGVLCSAAELLGLIERSLEITLDYLKVRKQFGQHIGAFQVLQHRVVDMWIQKSLTRAALRSALTVFSDPAHSAQDRKAAASSAKARASQAAIYVAGQAIQLHGAIGTTDEYELGVYVNRCLTLAAQWGNAATHRRRYGDLVNVQER